MKRAAKVLKKFKAQHPKFIVSSKVEALSLA